MLVLPLCTECRLDVFHAGPRLVEQYESLLQGLHLRAWRLACMDGFLPDPVLLLSCFGQRPAYWPLAADVLSGKVVVQGAKLLELPALYSHGCPARERHPVGLLGVHT